MFQPHLTFFVYHRDGEFGISGICVCGYGPKLVWIYECEDGSLVPRCNGCQQRATDKPKYREIDQDALNYFEVRDVLES